MKHFDNISLGIFDKEKMFVVKNHEIILLKRKKKMFVVKMSLTLFVKTDMK